MKSYSRAPFRLERLRRRLKASVPKASESNVAIEDLAKVARHIWNTSTIPESDELKLVLAHFGGLKAREIAQLTIGDLLGPDGEVGSTIRIRGARMQMRLVPMHAYVQEAAKRFRIQHPHATFISLSRREPRREATVNAVTGWFRHIYRDAGLPGLSSHSGREDFIRILARAARACGENLDEVREAVGHSRNDTTASYLDDRKSHVTTSIRSSQVQEARNWLLQAFPSRP